MGRSAGISKEGFLKAIKVIEKRKESDLMFGEAISNIYEDALICYPANICMDALLEVLAEVMDDKYDYITWWLFETSDYVVWSETDNKKWDLHEAESLYDFLLETREMSEKERTELHKGITECVKAEVDLGLKDRVEDILKSVGLTPQQAISIFYKQIALKNGIPFKITESGQIEEVE